jgi:TetR/AcrR family transcriptional regulator, lmrAB and yxaGH operons repressor
VARQRKTIEGSTSDSRQRLVETAARLFRVQGYHATGLNQIVEESKAPKGSLYHYFPDGKEQLGAEALSAAGRQLHGKLQALVQMNPFQALDKLLEMSIEELESSDYCDGCPIATVALETTASSTVLRDKCSAIFDRALHTLQGWLMDKGVARQEAESLAVTVFAAFEGALILCKVQRSSEPLKAVVHQMKTFLKLSLPT